MPGIQPQHYLTRVTEHSTLSPQALLVAFTIAQLRYKKRVKPHEPLPLTGAALAKACHMSERTLDRYLGECIASGWVIGRIVHRTPGGPGNQARQQANEYFLCDMTDGESECRRLRAEIALGGKVQGAGVAGKPRRRLHTVRRSTYNGAADDAALRGGGGSDEQGRESDGRQPQPPPALGGAEVDSGGMVGETRNPQLEEQPPDDPASTDAAVFAGWDSDDQAADVAELAGGLVRPRERIPLARSNQQPPSGACHHCGRTRPVPSGNPRLWECAHCGRYWLATPTKPRLALA